MAELLIVVVVAAALVLYAIDRARKLRARARQMAGMNDRLEAAAEKIDEEQRRKRARVRASAELTSVMPAIKRPPLTIPGMAGHGPEAAEEAAPAAENGPAGDSPAGGSLAAERRRPRQRDRPAQESTPAEEAPAAAEASPAPALRPADSTQSMPAAAMADEIPAQNAQAASEGTMIMAPVPRQGPAPRGRSPAGSRSRNRRARRQSAADQPPLAKLAAGSTVGLPRRALAS